MEGLEELKTMIAEISKAVKAGVTEDKVKALIAVALEKSNSVNKYIRKGDFNVSSSISISKSNDPKIVEFKKRADDVIITSTLMNTDARNLRIYKELKEFAEGSELTKAIMDTSSTGYGAEWVPTELSSDLVDRVRLELKVATLFQRVDMPTDPFKIPGKKSSSTAKYVATHGSAPTETRIGTREIILVAKKIMDYVPCSYELVEDSIVPLLPMIKDDLSVAIAEGIENAIINGDTTNPHQDNDTTAGGEDVRTAWIGLRKAVLSAAKKDLGTFNIANVRSLRAAQGKYGVDINRLAYITGIAGYNKLLNLDEVKTVDKYGPLATILTGELAKLDGIPIIISEFVREDLNATGVYDGTTTNKTVLLLVRRDGWLIGDRRQFTVETDRVVKAQTIDLVAAQRLAFTDRYDRSTEKIVAVGYNIA